MSFDENSQTICRPNSATYSFIYKTFLGFNEETTFSTINIPSGVEVNFNPVTASEDGTEVKVVVSNTSSFPLGENEFIIKGTSTSVIKQVLLDLNLYDNTIANPIPSFPENNKINVATNVALTWDNDANSEDYLIEISTDDSFNNIIDTTTIKERTFSSLNLDYNTAYYWRVKGTNNCSESEFSDISKFTTLCLAPDIVKTDNITINNVDISWSENGGSDSWEIEIVLEGETPSGSGEIVSTRNYTATSLSSSTKYDIYVRSLCTATSASLWVGPIAFSTLVDYCNGENFYDSGGIDGSYQNDEYIVTEISANGGDLVEMNFLSFDIQNGYDVLHVYDRQGDNYLYLASYTGNSLPPVIRSSQGGSLAFLFRSDGSVSGDGWEAEVSCITLTCPAPTNFVVTNTAANSVDLNWVSNGDETKWELEYGEVGFTLGTGTKVLAIEKPFKLEGLNPTTNYNIYVRAICGENTEDDDSLDKSNRNKNSLWNI